MQIDLLPNDQLLPVQRAAAEQPALIYVAGLGRSSQRTMYGALTVIATILTRGECTAQTMPWHQLRRGHLMALRAWLIEQRSPATGRRLLAAVKGTMREAWRMGQLSTDDYSGAIDVKAIKGNGIEQAAGRALSEAEKIAIIAVLGSGRPVDIRNSAIFGLAVYGGLRRAEIAALPVTAYEPNTNALVIRGKGNKQRTVYVAPGVDTALADWLALRKRVATADTGYLFTRVLKCGRILPQGITPAAIYGMLQEMQQRAKVAPFSPHDLRRTFAGDLLDAGVDMATVQRLMGHSNADTTSRYDAEGGGYAIGVGNGPNKRRCSCYTCPISGGWQGEQRSIWTSWAVWVKWG